ncbi:MAG TPA: hypothetical protein VER96_41505 [Polyangiaceae bacterium]|nr:hypothetical protein [Polyangiaceae bacterium]
MAGMIAGLVCLSLTATLSSLSGCARRESPAPLPSSTAPAASAEPPPCPLRISTTDFEACNLDRSRDPLCFHFALWVGGGRRGICLPGRATLAVLGSRRYQTDELVVTLTPVSGDAGSPVIELRLQSMRGSQGFFKGPLGSVVGEIHMNARRPDHFNLGPGLLPSQLNVRTAEWTDVTF